MGLRSLSRWVGLCLITAGLLACSSQPDLDKDLYAKNGIANTPENIEIAEHFIDDIMVFITAEDAHCPTMLDGVASVVEDVRNTYPEMNDTEARIYLSNLLYPHRADTEPLQRCGWL